MKYNYYRISSLLIFLLASFVVPSTVNAGITLNQNTVELSLAPACDHVPLYVPYEVSVGAFDESSIMVSSDSSWVTPSVNTELDRIDLNFSTGSLLASYTAIITVDDGDNVTELSINASVSPLDIYRLLDDPLRSKAYGIQRNGIDNGSIVTFDPVDNMALSCLTVGEGPTDFVINDDSSELFVINSVEETINVIDLDTFSLKETIQLPVYSAWGDSDDTTANIDLGPADIIYYVDGSWGPVLHVFKRSTGAVLQSIAFNGSPPSGSKGFMDFAVTSDKTKVIAMPQLGWSAGAHSQTIGHYTISADGTLNFVKETQVLNFSREPFEAPVLISANDELAVLKTVSSSPANTDAIDRSFPSAVWSMAPNASVVATADKLYEYETGKELYTIPGGDTSGSGYTYTKAQAFTSDFNRFIYFTASNRTLNVVNLVDEIGLDVLGRSPTPPDGGVVNSPSALIWAPLDGVDQYDIYLGTDIDSVSAADTTSPLYLGRVTGTSLALIEALTIGTEYFWRVDPVTVAGPEVGEIYTFTVSGIQLSLPEIDVRTVEGHADYQVDIELESTQAGSSWSATSADPWVTFGENSGVTPATLQVHIDATVLTSGFYNSSITLLHATGPLEIPVKVEVDSLSLTHIRSDRLTSKVYAISEDINAVPSRAYLLEVDTISEAIQRVTPVGSSVTDFAIHYADDLLYVTNWKSGSLLEIDRTSFQQTDTLAFQPAGAAGYSGGDVYRVAAGVSERLVVEEEDQWIDLSLINTDAQTELDTAFSREGGGAFDPTGRYYYHGESNSSGASIIKFDTAGDAFTEIADVRPAEIVSYYGSRTVVVSEDGSRIFWAGVVLDQNLQTEWTTGDIIYSTTANGRYAFSDTQVYDVDLQRQVFTMPATTSVSGYNSTSNKLMVQDGNVLRFYDLGLAVSMPAPTLSVINSTNNSVSLSWTDDTLESGFSIQQRLVGTGTWNDVHTTAANVRSWTSTGLRYAATYEFRVRANFNGNISPWSEVVQATVGITNSSPVVDDGNDFLSYFIPMLIASLNKPVVEVPDSVPTPPNDPSNKLPQWAVQNNLCCRTSSATFKGTIDGVTLTSNIASCSVASGSRSSFVETTEGSKTISASVSAATCSGKSFNISKTFRRGKSYTLTLDLAGAEPSLVVVERDLR